MTVKVEMQVEVAYATPDVQEIREVVVDEGAAAEAAIRLSGILDRFPEIDLASQRIGIFGKSCSLEHELQSGDRVEIYRPLAVDPKDARRNRARKR